MKFLRKTSMICAASLALTGTAGILPLSLTAQAVSEKRDAFDGSPVYILKRVSDDAGIAVYNINTDGTASVNGLNDPEYAGELSVLPEIEGYPVTEIESGAFSGCKNLTGITIPDSVTKIESQAFSGCVQLKNITLGKNLEFIGENAFLDTPWLAEHKLIIVDQKLLDGHAAEGNIVIPDGVTAIADGAFQNNTKLTGITFPDSLKEIGNTAFSQCNGLESITIPDSVTKLGSSAFSACDHLKDVTFGNNLKEIGRNAFGWTPWLNEQKFLIVDHNIIDGRAAEGDIVIPDGVTAIADCAFEDNVNLTGIIIPDSVTFIGSNAFRGCENLKQAVLPEGLTRIYNGTFSGCTALTSVRIPDSVSFIFDEAFHDCKGLTRLTLPDSVTGIYPDAFSGCTGLTSLTIPKYADVIMSNAFSGCTGLTSVIIPDQVFHIGANAFAYCTELAEITIPESVNTIQEYAFFGTKWLENRQKENPLVIVNQILIDGTAAEGDVIIPDGVKKITDHAFDQYYSDAESKLTGVTIPDSVTGIETAAFSDCAALTSVRLSENLKFIPSYAFYQCSSLDHVTVPASVTEIGYKAFEGCSSLKDFTVLNPECNFSNPVLQLTPEPVEWGDASCDQKVDIADAVLICRFAVQDSHAVMTDAGKTAADVTHDGRVDAEDAGKLLQYIAKKLTFDDLCPVSDHQPSSDHQPYFTSTDQDQMP